MNNEHTDFSVNNEDSEEWNYKQIDFNSDEVTLSKTDDDSSQFNYAEQWVVKQINRDEDNKIEKELKKKQKILDKEKVELERLISLVKDIASKLQNLLIEFDEELLEILVHAVKKIVEHIILREMNSDPVIIFNMVCELRKLIAEDDDLTTIVVSQHDAIALQNIVANSNLKIITDPALSQGDVILKNKCSELSALLKKRIDKIVEI